MMSQISVSAAGMRVVKLLVGQSPQTVADLIHACGVTRTAVTEQLNELVAAGFVKKGTERLPGRGRPRHVYSATNSALTALFAGNEWLVVPAIWDAIDAIGGKRLKKQVLKRVSLDLADHYKRRIRGKTPADRFRELAKVLREEEGNLIEIEKRRGKRLAMRRLSCSFFSMFEESRSVCHLDEELMTLVVGTRVNRTACRHDGDACCVFEIAVNEQ